MIERRFTLLAIVGAANALVILLIGATFLGYWFRFAEPLIRTEQQTKTELVAASYSRAVADALGDADTDAVASVLGEVLLLREPGTGDRMIRRVELELPDGKTITEGDTDATTESEELAVEVPLFSEATFELLGTMRMYKSGETGRQATVFAATGVVVLILLLALNALLWILLRPLRNLTGALGDVDWATMMHMPTPRGYATAEIQSVIDAVRQLLHRLEGARADVETQRKTLEVQAAELSQINAELERFTYTVSHDLKSPLITITGFLGLLEQDVRSGDADRAAEDMVQIKGAASQMRRLLDDVLELSRVGRIAAPEETLEFADLAKQAVELVTGRLEECGVKVHVDVGNQAILCDRTRIIEVLQNLLENAIKFMGEQESPRILVTCRVEKDGPVFVVQDNGVGIDPEYHERVFGLFNRLSAEGEGTGIGLALVKRIVEVHGGKIWIESEGIGRGTSVCFTLPGPNAEPT